MKRVTSLVLSVVLCLIIVVGYMAGIKQEAGADDGPYGKYVFSADPTQYLELRPDGSYLIVAREYTPSGVPGNRLVSINGTYEIKGDIVSFIGGPTGKLDWKLEGNTLVPTQPRFLPRGLEGAKYIKE